jgi:HSP20 family protein
MSCGSFMRSFSLPADTDPDKISAEFVNGVLTIEVPKPAASQPKQITVH